MISQIKMMYTCQIKIILHLSYWAKSNRAKLIMNITKLKVSHIFVVVEGCKKAHNTFQVSVNPSVPCRTFFALQDLHDNAGNFWLHSTCALNLAYLFNLMQTFPSKDALANYLQWKIYFVNVKMMSIKVFYIVINTA